MIKRKLLAFLAVQIVLVNFYGLTSGVKTTSGKRCAFPFTYKGVVYKSCTTKNHNRPWCSTTTIYAGNWGNCAGLTSGVKTTKGEYCAFPFTYKSVVYKSCTTKNHNRPWCSTTASYDKDKKWGNCAGLTSGVKTTKGEYCAFPFTYKGVVYKSCTTKNHNRPWCSTTANYDKDKKWGNCVGLTSGVKTAKGEYCVFPFTYKGVVYKSCTTKNHNRPWCSTTANYDKDKKWGNCAGLRSGVKTTSGGRCASPFTYKGVVYKSCTTKDHNRPWCSTTTIYAGNWGNCAGLRSGVKTTSGGRCASPFTYKGVVYKSCTTKDHNRPWCSTTTIYAGNWGNCAGFYSNGVKTTSGNYCAFPFIYKGHHYNTCTRKDHTRLWCSSTTNYDKDKKWGNCA